MSVTTTAGPWWRTAPNPPCASFCDREHAPDEFTNGGALMCTANIAQTKWFDVDLQNWVGVGDNADDAAVPLVREPVSIYLHHHRGVINDLTAAEAREYVSALQVALAEAARRVDEANLGG